MTVLLLRCTFHGALWFLLLESLCLYLFARHDMSSAVGALVLVHIALGLLLMVPFFIWIFRGARPHAQTSFRHWLVMLTALTCAATGVWLTAQAAAGNSTAHARGVLILHILSGSTAAIILIVPLLSPYLLRTSHLSRITSRVSRLTSHAPHFGAIIIASVATLLTAYSYAPHDYYHTLTASNVAQAGNELFPAGLSIIGDSKRIARASAYCGAAGCHADIYRQWQSSTHRRAASDPFYRKSADYFASRKGSDAVRWCAGCHEPKTHNLKPEGVNCLVCHATTRVKELTGNGRYELTLPSEYPFADHPHRALRWLHGFLIRVRPAPHQRAFLKRGVHDTSEFCSSCHRVSFNVPQNHYKFLRGQDEYGEWQDSYLSGNSVHGFFPPTQQKRCQDCHDPHNSFAVRREAQRSAAADRTLLRSVRDYEPVTVDIFALRRPPTAPLLAQEGKGEVSNSREEELIAPLHGTSVRPGESVIVDVVVHNRGVGHDFPTGVTDIKDVWLEFKVADSKGRVFFHSGGLSPSPPAPLPGSGGREKNRAAASFREKDGRRTDNMPPLSRAAGEGSGMKAVDENAHFYRLVALDRAGQRIDKNNLFDMVTPLYERTIPAGQSDVVRYRFTVPEDAGGALTLTARLNHRRFNAWFTHWVYAGRRDAGEKPPPVGALTDTTRWTFDPVQPVPQLPVRVVAEDRVTLQPAVNDKSTRNTQHATRISHRFYNYGVALLTQGDLPRAARAFQRMQALAPKDVRASIGLGRVYLAEGDLLAAKAQFLAALRIAPRSPQTRAFLGKTLRKMGQYDRALVELQPVAEQFPRDRLLHFDIGMSYFLSGRYEEASRAFRRMLNIDPDDLSAHYNLMLCYQRLRRVTDARREEAIYRYLKEDEPVKQITGPYLLTHPIDDREVQTIHEHVLRPISR